MTDFFSFKQFLWGSKGEKRRAFFLKKKKKKKDGC